jgi:hypothetical protein
MNEKFIFSFSNYKKLFVDIQNHDYDILTIKEYIKKKKQKSLKKFTLVNRVDVDISLKKLSVFLKIFDDLNIKATIFIRLHAKEYNLFSFENYKIITKAIKAGHEIGYHSEVIDQSIIWKEDAIFNFRRDINILEKIFNIKILGSASHGGITGDNNLDFWVDKKPKDFDLLYEAYDSEAEFGLFKKSFYISDSEIVRWKCYKNGLLVKGDNKSLHEHLKKKYNIIYLLTHPDFYFSDHVYED